MLFYFSTSVTELLVSGFLQGVLPTILLTMSIMILTEYTTPRYRGIFITFKGATFYWGIWVSNAIGTYYHWKNIGILIFICCIYNISVLFWPESPYWLASKGRFEECIKLHRWLKGEDNDSEEELQELISSQKKVIKQNEESQYVNKRKSVLIIFCNTVKAKSFYKPLLYSLLTMCLYHVSGKLACTGYAIDIFKKITGNESTAYHGMLILDGVTVFGTYIGVFLNKLLKRRTLLLGASSIGVTFLFTLSIYLYLVRFNTVAENTYVTLFFLIVFSVTISCGPMIMSLCFCTELTPFKDRSLFVCIFSLFTNVIAGTALKVFPYMFKGFGSHGSFLVFAVLSSIFIFILYKILPETKDKTIQNIEKSFLDKSECERNLRPLLHD